MAAISNLFCKIYVIISCYLNIIEIVYVFLFDLILLGRHMLKNIEDTLRKNMGTGGTETIIRAVKASEFLRVFLDRYDSSTIKYLVASPSMEEMCF